MDPDVNSLYVSQTFLTCSIEVRVILSMLIIYRRTRNNKMNSVYFSVYCSALSRLATFLKIPLRNSNSSPHGSPWYVVMRLATSRPANTPQTAGSSRMNYLCLEYIFRWTLNEFMSTMTITRTMCSL